MILLWAMAAALVMQPMRTDIVFLKVMPRERAMLIYERLYQDTDGGEIQPGRQQNMLVVRGPAGTLDAFRAVLERLDTAEATERRLFIRPTQHQSPSHLAALARQVMDARGYAPVLILPDDRTKQLVISTTREQYRQLDALFRRLDKPDHQGASPPVRQLADEHGHQGAQSMAPRAIWRAMD